MKKLRSGRALAAAPNLDLTRSFSARLWDVPWSELFPLTISGDLRVEKVPFATLGRYIQSIPPTESRNIIAGAERMFRLDLDHPSRERFYEEMGDFFLFFDADRPVGYFVCTVHDWSTYYFRSIFIERSHRRRGLAEALMQHLIDNLHGVTRIEGDVPPTNTANFCALVKLGFLASGVANSERWGSVVHFVKYLDPAHEQTFRRCFTV